MIDRHRSPAPALLVRSRRTTSRHPSRAVVERRAARSQSSDQATRGGTRRLARRADQPPRTPAGEVFRDRAARILEQLDQAARETARVGQGEVGSLVVGAVSTAVCSILPEMLRGIRREAPSITIDIREMEPVEQVEALRRRDNRYRPPVPCNSKLGVRLVGGFEGALNRGSSHVPESFRNHLKVRGCVYRDIAGTAAHAISSDCGGGATSNPSWEGSSSSSNERRRQRDSWDG